MDVTQFKALLRTELQSAQYLNKTDEEAAAILNAASSSALGPLQRMKMLRWAAAAGAKRKLRTASNGNGPAKDLAEIGELLLEGPLSEEIHLEDSEMQAFIDALVTAEVLTPADRTALLARATIVTPRTQTLFGLPSVSPQDIAEARII